MASWERWGRRYWHKKLQKDSPSITCQKGEKGAVTVQLYSAVKEGKNLVKLFYGRRAAIQVLFSRRGRVKVAVYWGRALGAGTRRCVSPIVLEQLCKHGRAIP